MSKKQTTTPLWPRTPIFKKTKDPADVEIERLEKRVKTLEETLRAVLAEMNWGASSLSADTIRLINESGVG